MTSADIIIIDARVLTIDESRPRAEAVAISGNRIAVVGSKADILATKAKHTRIIDAQMKAAMPGIVESHLHMFIGAVERESLIVNHINGFDQLSESVREYAKMRPKDSVIVLDGDIEATPASRVSRLKPNVTICDGRVTFERQPP